MHTGNTSLFIASSSAHSVHPRAYGEHWCVHVFGHHVRGSSPCIRGTLSHTVRKSLKMRFIPVHTGNTPRISLRTIISPVHPRAYGEHLQSMQPVNIRYGSSPCIRGTPAINATCEYSIRFIPVHTGNTKKSLNKMRFTPVHPRAYGEHAWECGGLTGFDGSSPCIRGTRIE